MTSATTGRWSLTALVIRLAACLLFGWFAEQLVGSSCPSPPSGSPSEDLAHQLAGHLRDPGTRPAAIEAIHRLLSLDSADVDPRAKITAIRALGSQGIKESEGFLRTLWERRDPDAAIFDEAYLAWLQVRLHQEDRREPRIEILRRAFIEGPRSCGASNFAVEELLNLGAAEIQQEIEAAIERCPSTQVEEDLSVARTKLGLLRSHRTRMAGLSAALKAEDATEDQRIYHWAIDMLSAEGTPAARDILLKAAIDLEKPFVNLATEVQLHLEKAHEMEEKYPGDVFSRALERQRPLVRGLHRFLTLEEMTAAGLLWADYHPSMTVCK